MKSTQNDYILKIKVKLIILVLVIFKSVVCLGQTGQTTKASRIIDGDTFETDNGEKVRLIGINAPEISDIFGVEAKQHLAILIEGKNIDLQNDNISKDRDRYSRLLRYVILNGNDINKQMLSDGFAIAYLKYHFAKEVDYRQAQIDATQNNNGMWNNNKKEKILEPHISEKSFLKSFTPKKYFITALISVLICFGFYFYFKNGL